ncbi:hypothetical protein CLG85_024190 [Yangia mangrovi]|uniref:Uncharacterized protein n=1 Tax=Alloyangia mangrovi TaxID=1779329 RepID=A0A2A3JST9_9RHOB|nr:hypothetical protein [Alloyangia mangrovi]MCA0940540.1 hypothetical protein [Alloyangia pacifica]MCA0945902.1 hypothetical protein [Alloyangia pacifica]MCT4373221.1 hypothetical protein [Alloyangia mangrovi]
MNKDFTGRSGTASRPYQARSVATEPGTRFAAHPEEDSRARRRRVQRLALLSFSLVTLLSLAGMIITRAMEIASL